MQTQLNCRAGWEKYWAGVQACPKDVGALHKEGNPIPFLGDVKRPERCHVFFSLDSGNSDWMEHDWQDFDSSEDLRTVRLIWEKGGDVLILTMLHSQRARPWWQASKVCIETEDKEYCLLCSSWGQELHLTIFIASRVTKSTDSGEDAGVTSKWKHTPTVLKKPLASV